MRYDVKRRTFAKNNLECPDNNKHKRNRSDPMITKDRLLDHRFSKREIIDST